MDINETLSLILQELQTLKAGQQSLEDGQQSLDSRLNNLENGQQSLEAGQQRLQEDVADIKDRTKKIEITLENDITQRLDSLADGYKLNGQKLDNVKEVVDDLDSTVTALDVLAQFQSSKPITLQIIK